MVLPSPSVAGGDTTPDAFTFTDQSGVALSTTITSAPITVSGITAAASITSSGGTFDINGSGTFISSGTVNNGDTVRARVTSSGSNSTAVNCTVTIGGVSDTFTATTVGAGAPSAPGTPSVVRYGPTSAFISWAESTAGAELIHQYNVYVKPSGGSFSLYGVTAAPYFSIDVLTASTSYDVYVQCEDEAGSVSSASGTVTFTTDSSGSTVANTPTFPASIPNTRYSLPTGGTTYTPTTASAFQSALNSAVYGDVIQIASTLTFTGTFTLPYKTGTGWIYIVTDQLASLPAPGTRVQDSHLTYMPTLQQIGGGNGPVVTAAAGAHNFRFVGIHMQPAPGATDMFAVVELGNSYTSLSDQQEHIVIDRCIINGDPTYGAVKGIYGNGKNISAIDSRIKDIKRVGQDAQCFNAINGSGPYKIKNCFLEASGENIMFGGGIPAGGVTFLPSDITLVGNHHYKPLSWVFESWAVKNSMELKLGKRVLSYGNLYENCWVGNQHGYAYMITPRDESGSAPAQFPDAEVSNVAIICNYMKDTGAGIQVAGCDDGHGVSGLTSQTTKRVMVWNNLIRPTDSTGSRRVFLITGAAYCVDGPQDLIIDSNTCLLPNGGVAGFCDLGADPTRFNFLNNIISNGTYTFSGTGYATANAVLANMFDANFRFTNNAFIDSASQGYSPSDFPSGNFYPASFAAVGFTNYAGEDYSLTSSSAYYQAGKNPQGASTGRDMGANMALIPSAA